jgi:hypothetical protein
MVEEVEAASSAAQGGRPDETYTADEFDWGSQGVTPQKG